MLGPRDGSCFADPMLDYDLPLFRPPSESRSLILQLTLGCSHNRCTFCSMYRTKRFRVVRSDAIDAAIRLGREALGSSVRRVFFADGDAMCLATDGLLDRLARVREAFPLLQRVGIYANARDVLSKSDAELAALRRAKLGIVYLGLESGDEETLRRVDKGATVDEIVRAGQRARAAGMRVSCMVLIGLAGRERSVEHARASAQALSRMAPDYSSLLTYTPTPASELFDALERGDFELPSALDSVREIRAIVAAIDCPTYFTCNHASNYLPLTGLLPEHREEMLALLDAALAGALRLKPEALRGL